MCCRNAFCDMPSQNWTHCRAGDRRQLARSVCSSLIGMCTTVRAVDVPLLVATLATALCALHDCTCACQWRGRPGSGLVRLHCSVALLTIRQGMAQCLEEAQIRRMRQAL